MSQSADFHSINFIRDGSNTYNSWNNFHLIPSSRPNIANPQRSFKYVDIPGRSGSLDLTTYLTGETPVYGDRSGTLEFVVISEYEGKIIDNRPWYDRKQELINFFDGRTMRIQLEDDPRYYYEGRITLESWQTGETYSAITLNYRLKPYKYNIATGQEAGI